MKSNYEKPSEKKKRIKLENLKRVKKFQRLRNRIQPLKIQEKIMPSGRVKWFNSKKGYGFITLDEDSQKDVFLHVNYCVSLHL